MLSALRQHIAWFGMAVTPYPSSRPAAKPASVSNTQARPMAATLARHDERQRRTDVRPAAAASTSNTEPLTATLPGPAADTRTGTPEGLLCHDLALALSKGRTEHFFSLLFTLPANRKAPILSAGAASGWPLQQPKLLLMAADSWQTLPLLECILHLPVNAGSSARLPVKLIYTLLLHIALLDSGGNPRSYQLKYRLCHELCQRMTNRSVKMSRAMRAQLGVVMKKCITYAQMYFHSPPQAGSHIYLINAGYHEYGLLLLVIKATGPCPGILPEGKTRLHMLCAMQCDYHIIKRNQDLHLEATVPVLKTIDCALAAGDNINARCLQGCQPLHYALSAGSSTGAVVSRLCQSGCQLDLPAPYDARHPQATPVGWAILTSLYHQNTGALQALLASGTHPNHRDHRQRTALDLVLTQPMSYTSVAILKLLLAHRGRLGIIDCRSALFCKWQEFCDMIGCAGLLDPLVSPSTPGPQRPAARPRTPEWVERESSV